MFFQVSVDSVLKTFKENAEKATKILCNAVVKIAARDWSEVLKKNEVSTHTKLSYQTCILGYSDAYVSRNAFISLCISKIRF